MRLPYASPKVRQVPNPQQCKKLNTTMKSNGNIVTCAFFSFSPSSVSCSQCRSHAHSSTVSDVLPQWLSGEAVRRGGGPRSPSHVLIITADQMYWCHVFNLRKINKRNAHWFGPVKEVIKNFLCNLRGSCLVFFFFFFVFFLFCANFLHIQTTASE